MDLILLRHGKAEDTHTQGDSARALVGKGRRQARRAALLLKQADFRPDIVLTSPLVRARQTADEFCEASGMPGPLVQDWLACGMSPESALAELAAFPEFDRVAIVGHEPDFSGLVEYLLGVGGGNVVVKKGTLVCVRIQPPARHGSLRFLIPTKLSHDPEF